MSATRLGLHEMEFNVIAHDLPYTGRPEDFERDFYKIFQEKFTVRRKLVGSRLGDADYTIGKVSLNVQYDPFNTRVAFSGKPEEIRGIVKKMEESNPGMIFRELKFLKEVANGN